MYEKKSFFIVVFALLLIYIPISGFENSSCKPIFDNVIATIKGVKTIRYHLKLGERLKDKIVYGFSDAKVIDTPRKLYLKNNDGVEVLWVTGERDGDALVNPNAFPYVNLHLNPYKSIMRNDQHHTIFDLGFELLGKVLDFAMKKSGNQFDKYFTLIGSVTFDNRDCYKMYFELPDFKYVNYTVGKNETARSIGEKLCVGDYRILLNNPSIGYNDPIKEGKILTVPSIYAAKTIMYIDKELNLPVYVKVYDDKGLYEDYEFTNIHINTVIAPEEFTKEYKGYGF